MQLFDISPTLSARIGVWPGDVPFSRPITCSISGGANIDLSAIHSTLHLGAHVDAPNHYSATGAGISERPLSLYFGPCQVMRVTVGRNQRIEPKHLAGPITAPRLLFRTETYPDPNVFNEDFAALSPALVDFAADAGVQLLGIDTPSVDLCKDAELLSHTAIARRDLAILEGIVLAEVPDGVYTLMAFPLKIEGADASPVRAVLSLG